jgi:hypothetical protein
VHRASGGGHHGGRASGYTGCGMYMNREQQIGGVGRRRREESSRSACLEEGELTMHQSTLQDFAQPNTTPVGFGYLSLDNVYIAI